MNNSVHIHSVSDHSVIDNRIIPSTYTHKQFHFLIQHELKLIETYIM